MGAARSTITKSINHIRHYFADEVYQALPAGELIKPCDIKVPGMPATDIMKYLTILKSQGRVRTYKYKHYQLWGRVDEFSY